MQNAHVPVLFSVWSPLVVSDLPPFPVQSLASAGRSHAHASVAEPEHEKTINQHQVSSHCANEAFFQRFYNLHLNLNLFFFF